MYQFHSESYEDRAYYDRAIQARAEAQGRAVYFVIVGVQKGAAFLGRASLSVVRRLARAYLARRRRRLAINELSRLDDRMLRDIGVAPGDIHAIATELTRDEPQLGGRRTEAAAERAVPAPVPRPSPAARTASPAAAPALRLDLDCLNRKPADGAANLAA